MTRFVVRCNKTSLVMGMITAVTLAEADFICASYFTADIWPMGVTMLRAEKGFRLGGAAGYKKRLDGPVPNFQKFALPGSRRKFNSQL